MVLEAAKVVVSAGCGDAGTLGAQSTKGALEEVFDCASVNGDRDTRSSTVWKVRCDWLLLPRALVHDNSTWHQDMTKTYVEVCMQVTAGAFRKWATRIPEGLKDKEGNEHREWKVPVPFGAM